MFSREVWYRRRKARDRAAALSDIFQSLFVEDDGRTPALLGTEELRPNGVSSYLLVVVRNASTDPAWQLLRASTAAPTYFARQVIQIGDRQDLFVDAAVTPYGNPALITALTATLPCYRIGWPTGTDRLLVVSMGTCVERTRLAGTSAAHVHLLHQIAHLAPALIGGMAQQQDLICRLLGECLHGAPIDSEIGDLSGPTLLQATESKFSYVRYNC